VRTTDFGVAHAVGANTSGHSPGPVQGPHHHKKGHGHGNGNGQ